MSGFSLNGEEMLYQGDPELSLLKYLRDERGITTVKDGCSGQAACGACLVELDGKAALACVTPMKKVMGKSVVTLDGFPEKVRRVLGRAFVAEGAVQCGFCTPGLVTRAKILLESNPDPSREEVVKALKAHVCRCTGYQKIVDAIILAARILREGGEIDLGAEPGINRSLPKYQAYEKALGLDPFVDDLRPEGLLHGVLRFSDHPRAKVISIDTSRAAAMPGVVRVFTCEDIPGKRHQGLIVKDWPMMVAPGEETRYIGDVLAAVVAKTESQARAAVAAVQVEYQELEPLTEMLDAAESPIKVHEGGNLLKETVIKRGGDVEKVFASSTHVVEGVYETPFQEHAFLETEASLAEPDGNGGLTVYSQNQGIFSDRDQVASVLDLSPDRIDVVQVAAGGAFGGKEDLSVQHHAALFAFLLNAPVKVKLSRPDSLRMHPKRHRMRMIYKLACDEKGRLTALRARITGDTGAYASVGGEVVARTGTHAAGAYHVPCVDVKAGAYYTNNLPCGAFRGFGVNQATFAMERMVEELCLKGGFDSWQFRYDNALTDGRVTTTGHVLGQGVGLRQCLDAVKDDYTAAGCAGLACAIKNCGIGNGLLEASDTRLLIKAPDLIELQHGWTEMGQGVHTVASQVLAEELGLDDSVTIEVVCRTANRARGGMTTASRGTVLVGNSTIQAAQKLKADLKGKTLADLVGREYMGTCEVDWTTPHDVEGKIVSHFSYGFAVHLAVLNEAGELKYVHAAHDGGRIINPTLFESQVHGGVAMGVGYALSENLPLENGRLTSERYSKLGLPKAYNMPLMRVSAIECPDPMGPFGAKGVGEIGNIPTAPAIANAFSRYDGKPRHRLPLEKPEKKSRS